MAELKTRAEHLKVLTAEELENFKENVRLHDNRPLEDELAERCKPYDVLISSFVWLRSDQGHDYWKDLHDRHFNR